MNLNNMNEQNEAKMRKRWRWTLFIIIAIGFIYSAGTFGTRGKITYDFYYMLTLVVPGLVLLFMSTFFKAIEEKTKVKNLLQNVLWFILSIFTAAVSWLVLVFIGFNNGTFSMSTYGTPIYRPETK